VPELRRQGSLLPAYDLFNGLLDALMKYRLLGECNYEQAK